jgi:hypothetical protein
MASVTMCRKYHDLERRKFLFVRSKVVIKLKSLPFLITHLRIVFATTDRPIYMELSVWQAVLLLTLGLTLGALP